ncbi:unknown protein [Desulfotalea psychrophila LSv54]|uniref:Uncharacterized protein n=1 Tax=Desulfotalea psychrophila (strain LSv54 / DSM 12343) TaxID=177439 RepID=Q6ARL7_DESPS|nr:unknown protein [Desulfotalea psychrophila LSv54]
MFTLPSRCRWDGGWREEVVKTVRWIKFHEMLFDDIQNLLFILSLSSGHYSCPLVAFFIAIYVFIAFCSLRLVDFFSISNPFVLAMKLLCVVFIVI